MTYLHSSIFPYIGYFFGYISTIASMAWEDGFRFIFGLSNTTGVQYIIENMYNSSTTVLNWSTRVDGGLFEVVGELLYSIVRAPISQLITPDAPLWVAFIFLCAGALLTFYVLKFFVSFII